MADHQHETLEAIEGAIRQQVEAELLKRGVSIATYDKRYAYLGGLPIPFDWPEKGRIALILLPAEESPPSPPPTRKKRK